MTINVLFVCFGNICRSPTAQGILHQKIAQQGLDRQITSDSCGTSAINAGKPADPRAIAAATAAGYDISASISRQISDADYEKYDYIIAMDRKNLMTVETWAPENYAGKIDLLMNFCENHGITQVPDPYYDDAEKFAAVLATLEQAIDGLLEHIKSTHLAASNSQ